MTTINNTSAVRVCPERDIECGRNPASWCATCPQRTNTSADAERAAFEAWAVSDDGGWMLYALIRNPEGHEFDYHDDNVEAEWRAWRASAAVNRTPATADVAADSIDTEEFQRLADKYRTSVAFTRNERMENLIAHINAWGARLAAGAPAETVKADGDLGRVMTMRDAYHDIADRLAWAIAKHLGIDIGEHSSDNKPWLNAYEAITQAAPVQTAKKD